MKLISSSPFTNNHSLSSHLALFFLHLLQKYVNRERGVTKLPYQISDDARAYTHTNTVVVDTQYKHLKLIERAQQRRSHARVVNSVTQK